MKKLFFILLIGLVGCSQESPNQQVATHDPLQPLSVPVNLETPSQTDADIDEDTNVIPTQQKEGFQSQQEFVDHMYEQIRKLEDTIALFNTNLNQILDINEDATLHLNIREGLMLQARGEHKTIEALTPFNEAVTNLHQYVTQAYYYTLESKMAEPEIYGAETLEERQILLDEFAEVGRLSTHYIDLAWEEINRLSETTFNRK